MYRRESKTVWPFDSRRRSRMMSLLLPDDIGLAAISSATMAVLSALPFFILALSHPRDFWDGAWLFPLLAFVSGGILGWVWLPGQMLPQTVFPGLIARAALKGLFFALFGSALGALLVSIISAFATYGKSLAFFPIGVIFGMVFATPIGAPGTILGCIIVNLVARKRRMKNETR